MIISFRFVSTGIRQELLVWDLETGGPREDGKKEIFAGVWDFMTGHLLFKLNNSALGAIITHGLIKEDGTFTVAAESGDVLYWDMKTRQVIFQA